MEGAAHAGAMTARPAPSTAHAVRRAHAPLVAGRPAVAPGRILTAALAAVLLVAGGRLLIPFTGDLPLTQAMNTLNTGPVGVLGHAVYQALEPAFAMVLTLAVAGLVALRRRDLGVGLRLGLGVALAWLPVGAVKLLVHRPRPAADALAHPTVVPAFDWTFPSGHVAFVTALAIMLTLVARTAAQRALRAVLGALAVAAIVATVLILGVHYPTDAAASVVWTLLVAPLMWQVAGLAEARVHRVLGRRGAARA